MNIEQLTSAARALKSKMNEDYLSIGFSLNLFKDSTEAEFTAYTPLRGHTKSYASPLEALAELADKTIDKDKCLAEIANLEERAKGLKELLGKAGL